MLLEKKRKLFAFFFVIFLYGDLFAVVPADICFLVVDFKFNEEQGVKFCEVQLARGSKFSGYAYTHPDQPKYIAEQFDAWISQYPFSKWALKGGLSDINLFMLFRRDWNFYSNFKRLEKNAEFVEDSSFLLGDPSALKSYGLLLYCPCSKIPLNFREKHPSVLIVDQSFTPYRNSKIGMNELFSMNNELAQFNPKWKIYSKEYTSELADIVIKDLDCDKFVIKPSGSSLGNGIIIVSKSTLDSTLKLILTNPKKCGLYEDCSYSYWSVDKSESFIIEEFVVSDPVLLQGKWYDPTIRYIVILSANEGDLRIDLLDGYCKLPCKAITDSGDLNALHKSCGEKPFYSLVPDEMKEKIESQIEEALLLLYEQILNISTKKQKTQLSYHLELSAPCYLPECSLLKPLLKAC